VRLLRHRARRPSGRHVVLHPHRGQQETRELDNGNVFGGENNLPLETWTGGSDGSPVDAGISSWVPVDGSIRKANQASVSRFAGQTETQDSRPYAPTGSPAGMVVRSTTSFSMPNICASVNAFTEDCASVCAPLAGDLWESQGESRSGYRATASVSDVASVRRGLYRDPRKVANIPNDSTIGIRSPLRPATLAQSVRHVRPRDRPL
jgi:hypothetical protein